MRLAKDLMAAPPAMIGAAASRDERDRTHAVVVAPGFDVSPDIYRFPIGPRLRVDIRDLQARGCAADRAVRGPEGDAVHTLECLGRAGR